jgi:hypothetical protein
MDQSSVVPFPDSSSGVDARDVVEIDAAIALVGSGVATRVRLVGLVRPEAAAGVGLAHAQDAGVVFRLERSAVGIAITIGPSSSGWPRQSHRRPKSPTTNP